MEEVLALSVQEKCNHAKAIIKTWEGEYRAANSKRPDKAALSVAPDDVKAAYKNYHRYRRELERHHPCEATNKHSPETGKAVHKDALIEGSKNSLVTNDNVGDSNIQCVRNLEEVSSHSARDSEKPDGLHGNESDDSAQMSKIAVVKTAAVESVCNGSEVVPVCHALVQPSCSESSSVWGKHLNKISQPADLKIKSKNDSLYTKMAEKLRASGSVKVRTSLKKTVATKKPRNENLNPLKTSKINSVTSTDLQTNKENVEDVSDECHTDFCHIDGADSSSSEMVTKENKLLETSHSLTNLSDSDFKETSASRNKQAESSIFDDLEFNSPKIPFRVQRKQCVNLPSTQAVSALCVIPSSDPRTEVPGIRKKASLNRGWLSRCTGTSLAEQHHKDGDTHYDEDSWKMRLIDKDWGEESNEAEESPENNSPTSFTVDEDDQQTHTRMTDNPASKKVRTRTKTTVRVASADKSDKNIKNYHVGENEEDVLGGDSVETKITPKRKVVRSKKVPLPDPEESIQTSDPDYLQSSLSALDGEASEDEDVNDKTWQQPKRRTGRSRKNPESQPVSETTHCNERNADSDENKTQDSEPVEKGIGKRKQVEDLEELEKTGKIQSLWPPPKKKRIGRKKTARSVVTVTRGPSDNQASGETRKRRKVPGKRIKKEDAGTVHTDINKNTKQGEDGKEPAHQSSSSIGDYNEIQDIESHGLKTTAKRPYMSTEERFARKVTTGTANSNFVRIDLKKKKFVRGKKTMTAGKYKRQEWKKKQIMKNAEQGHEGAIKKLTCFKCGDFGHWSKNCIGMRGDALMPLEVYDEKESTFLSLEDAASLAVGIKSNSSALPVSKMFPQSDVSEESQHKKDDVDQSHCFQPDTLENTETDNNREGDDTVDDNQEKHTLCEVSTELPEDNAKYGQMDFDNDIFANLTDTDMHGAADEVHTRVLESFVSHNESAPSQTDSGVFSSQGEDKPTVEPLYCLESGKVIATPDEVYEALQMFGYSSFRPGQEKAIIRVLSGLSTLLVLSTGSGKSLCYQLPAYLYAKHSHCITICVSPLVSLMEDQVTGMPRFLKAVCLHTHQNPTQRAHAVNAIRSGVAQILLVSPEAVVMSRSGGVLGTLLKELPPVAFACLDEAHCVSQWSHNFRPSYLRVCQVLREKLGVHTILGLTATARQTTTLSIAQHLLISDVDTGIICGTSVPGNLHLSVSRDPIKEQAVISLLQGKRFSECSSIIIYCTRRDECERVATLIRTQLLNPSKVDVKSNLKRTRGMSFDAEAYHAGMSSHRRQQVQKWFMSGKLRIVVATVAFGMGIDKADVRGIIHFNMPRNAESYVQEIGRAGRDGKVSHCHLFLDAVDGRDIQELKRHIFANSMDRHTVRKLLNKIFKPCACGERRTVGILQDEKEKHSICSASNFESDKNSSDRALPASSQTSPCISEPSSLDQMNKTAEASEDDQPDTNPASSSVGDPFHVTLSSSSCPQHEIAIPIEKMVEELDIPQENLETLLCYLELHQGNLIHLNSNVYANCTVSCYKGPRQLVAVSRKCPPLAVAIALECQKGINFDKSSTVTFPVVEVASRMGWNSKIVKRELKALEWNTQDLKNGGKIQRTGVMVEFTDLAFHLCARGDLTDDECDDVLDSLFRRVQTQEKDQLRQLYFMYQLLHSVSHGSILLCCDAIDMNRCTRLRGGLQKYFSKEGMDLSEVKIEEKVSLQPEAEINICRSVRALLSTHIDQQWTGRAVARVFHGIGSPNFPSEIWCRVRRFWRQHLNADFNLLVSLATKEILRSKHI